MTTMEINKEKMFALKEELKTIAEEIKKTKPAFKKSQRNNNEPWIYQEKLESLRFHFRHKLIAYSLTRGRTYEQIESHVREGNKPNWNYIRGLQMGVFNDADAS